MLRIGITGACGKMGKRIAGIASKDADIAISALLERKDAPEIGTSAFGCEITPDLAEQADKIDCLIDFTAPQATLENLKVCRDKALPIVIGTTGIDAYGEEKIKEAATGIPIVFSPNMSVGVNLLFKIVSEAARVLGKDFDIKVDETHHVHKKDSPSGTAKMIARVIKDSCGKDVPVEAFREGEVVGNHGIIFDSVYETLEIRHDAKTRDVFVAGAIKAAKFIVGQGKGLYSMQDVLGLK